MIHSCVIGVDADEGSTARDRALVHQAQGLGLAVRDITSFRLAHLTGDLTDEQVAELVRTLLVDPVGQWWCAAADHRPEGVVVETGRRPGVTDREAAELARAAATMGWALDAVALGQRFVIDGDLDHEQISVLAHQVLHNEVVERWADGELEPAFVSAEATAAATAVIPLEGLDRPALEVVSRERRLGLDGDEMLVIQAYFASAGRAPTDAELETLAQTWSEHCSHKTFRAEITVDYPDGSTRVVDGLLSSLLRAATDAIGAPWVHSAFVDNAGIVAFEEGWDVALKAETHNHPSALEPFGGANTGVGGVVRDILGVSAKPVAVSDILCFGPTDLDPALVPDGVLHPQRIRTGVIAGIGDYGNKIGVPNIAGAIVHDPAYTTTPLVFAGCIGLLPHGSNPTDARPGDAIVVLGGAVGRDGVGGATFSSQTMGVDTADVAGASVQIGDPIVEKGLIDTVLAARDAGLYNAITDCGAGGLSSAVGEMAEELGAVVDLADVPRKYPGLAPWEVWLSEAQERMVLAAPDPAPVLALAERWNVGAAVIGHFTGEGRLVVRDGSDPDAPPVIDLDCGFLHDGRPRRRMRARARDRGRPPRSTVPVDAPRTLLALLTHPSIRSQESVLRTYDHEVLGGTYVRPYGGVAADGPADGTVLIPPGTSGERGLAVGIGVNALLGRHDAEAMAWSVIDEAVRNVVIAGADPGRLSLLDNFAWGDPGDPDTLGALVAACQGCHDASLHLGAPFVSGKDSLFNVFVPPGGEPDPVAETLVITAVGIVDDLAVVPVTGVLAPNDDVWLVGPMEGALGGSHLDAVLGADGGGDVPGIDRSARDRHHHVAAAIAAGLVRSAHDLSEGGLAVAAAEWAHAGRLGLSLDVPGTTEVLFGEGAGRYLVEVAPADRDAFAALVPTASIVGSVVADPVVTIGAHAWTLDEIADAYCGVEGSA